MYYNLYPLSQLARKYGRVEYVRDIFAAANNRLKMLYTKDEFYIAEDSTYEPWLSVMGDLPSDVSKKQFFNMIADYVKREKYIAVYTNNTEVSAFFKSFPQLTYHEDFLIGEITSAPPADDTEIRLATLSDLNFIDKTYPRSAREQLQSRIIARQMWVAEKEGEIMGYAGIHKDGSLGFEYVAPKWRKKGVATNLQCHIANIMLENQMTSYVMISKENAAGINLQNNLNTIFAKRPFCFFAKGSYVLE